jgi:ABC-type lipoprotein export system ATPase subunit
VKQAPPCPSRTGRSIGSSAHDRTAHPHAERKESPGQTVDSLKLNERADIRNREIGFTFQTFNLVGDLTVYENVELPLTYRDMGISIPLTARR